MVRDPERSGGSNMQLVCRSNMADGKKSQKSHCEALITIVRSRSIKKKACLLFRESRLLNTGDAGIVPLRPRLGFFDSR